MAKRKRQAPVPFLLMDVLERLKITKSEAARAAGMDPSQLDRYTSATSDPQWTTVVRLARALDVGIEEFLPKRYRKGQSRI